MDVVGVPLLQWTAVWVGIFATVGVLQCHRESVRAGIATPKASVYDTFTTLTTNTRARTPARDGGAHNVLMSLQTQRRLAHRTLAIVSGIHALITAVHAALTLNQYYNYGSGHSSMPTAQHRLLENYGHTSLVVMASYVGYDLTANALLSLALPRGVHVFPWTMAAHHGATLVAMICARSYGEVFYTAQALLSEFSTPLVHLCKLWRDDLSADTLRTVAAALAVAFFAFRVVNFPVIAVAAAMRCRETDHNTVYASIAASMGFLALLNWYWFYLMGRQFLIIQQQQQKQSPEQMQERSQTQAPEQTQAPNQQSPQPPVVVASKEANHAKND